MLIFIYGVIDAFVRKQQAADNPWGAGATTLEWTLSSPPPFHQFETAAAGAVIGRSRGAPMRRAVLTRSETCSCRLSITTPSICAPRISEAEVGDYIALLKPRVMSLVIFTALVGLVIAPGHFHPVLAFTSILCIAVGAGASGALNMAYEGDIDALMSRTANRPIPRGRITPPEARRSA